MWDGLTLITDSDYRSQLRSGSFLLDPPLCWVESKHETPFNCYKSQTECLECWKTAGRRSGTPPLLPLGSSFGRSGIQHLLLSNLTTAFVR